MLDGPIHCRVMGCVYRAVSENDIGQEPRCSALQISTEADDNVDDPWITMFCIPEAKTSALAAGPTSPKLQATRVRMMASETRLCKLMSKDAPPVNNN